MEWGDKLDTSAKENTLNRAGLVTGECMLKDGGCLCFSINRNITVNGAKQPFEFKMW